MDIIPVYTRTPNTVYTRTHPQPIPAHQTQSIPTNTHSLYPHTTHLVQNMLAHVLPTNFIYTHSLLRCAAREAQHFLLQELSNASHSMGVMHNLKRITHTKLKIEYANSYLHLVGKFSFSSLVSRFCQRTLSARKSFFHCCLIPRQLLLFTCGVRFWNRYVFPPSNLRIDSCDSCKKCRTFFGGKYILPRYLARSKNNSNTLERRQ